MSWKLIDVLLLVFIAVYVEFFNDSFVNEAGYIAPEHMDPIQDAFKPKKPSRKFEKSLEAAKEEQSRIDGIVHVSDSLNPLSKKLLN